MQLYDQVKITTTLHSLMVVYSVPYSVPQGELLRMSQRQLMIIYLVCLLPQVVISHIPCLSTQYKQLDRHQHILVKTWTRGHYACKMLSPEGVKCTRVSAFYTL